MTRDRSQRATTKEERDIGGISSLTVNSNPCHRGNIHNYEAERFTEEDPKIRETSARRPEKTGQTKAKTTRGRDGKSGENQKESGCSCRCQAFQANGSQEIRRR